MWAACWPPAVRATLQTLTSFSALGGQDSASSRVIRTTCTPLIRPQTSSPSEFAEAGITEPAAWRELERTVFHAAMPDLHRG